MTLLVSRLISLNIWSFVWFHIMYITIYVCIKKIMYFLRRKKNCLLILSWWCGY